MAFGDMLKVKNVREIKADFFTREFLDIPTHHELQLRHLGLEVLQLGLCGLQLPTLALPALNLNGKNC